VFLCYGTEVRGRSR